MKGDKQQFVHKLLAGPNSLVGLAITSLETESLSNLRDLVGKMLISAQRTGYLLIAVKNCSMISVAQFFADLG